MAPHMPNPALVTRGSADAFSVPDSIENNGSLSEPQDFRPIADIVADLIRELWRQQHGERPCPLDRPRLTVVEEGPQ